MVVVIEWKKLECIFTDRLARYLSLTLFLNQKLQNIRKNQFFAGYSQAGRGNSKIRSLFMQVFFQVACIYVLLALQ